MNETPNEEEMRARAYWRENVQLLSILLAVWFAVSFGAGILFVEFFNRFTILGVKAGFWFAQQGSIIIFVILIFVYAGRMRSIDKKYGADED